MPELPEVEAARLLAKQHLGGQKIESVLLPEGGDEIIFCGLSPEEVTHRLAGKTVEQVCRRGKQLWMELSKPPHVAFHFGMTGKFFVKGVPSIHYKEGPKIEENVWPPRFYKMRMLMKDGVEFAFADPRRLGRVKFFEDSCTEPFITSLGVDPLNDDINETDILGRFASTKVPIKAALLDQTIFAGIGNWVADEVLYQSSIHPEAITSSLSSQSIIKLIEAIKYVVKTACGVSADHKKFPESWIFHYRWNSKATKDYYGKKLIFKTVAGRTSAIVPEAQIIKGMISSEENEKLKKISRVDKPSRTASVPRTVKNMAGVEKIAKKKEIPSVQNLSPKKSSKKSLKKNLKKSPKEISKVSLKKSSKISTRRKGKAVAKVPTSKISSNRTRAENNSKIKVGASKKRTSKRI